MSKPALTVDLIVKSGFRRLGSWEVSAEGNLIHNLDLPTRSGVYAFAIDGIVKYVGLASTSLRQRLGFYRTPGASQATNIRLNAKILTHITKGVCVEVLVSEPPDFEWNGLKVQGAQGLEAGLISTFDLPWNVRGSISSARLTEDGRMKTGSIKERIREAVAARPHMTEAYIARKLFGPKATQQRVNGHCREMVAAGLLIRQGSGGPGDAFTYRLAK